MFYVRVGECLGEYYEKNLIANPFLIWYIFFFFCLFQNYYRICEARVRVGPYMVIQI
jgi:hypothetical protein